jgi:hypothetical protein
MKRHMLTVCLIALGLGLMGVCASAQITQDFAKINYFSNNGVSGAPDATVRIDNPGSPTETSDDDSTGPANLCAQIYVFDNDQQLTECCGCLVTPDGLRTLSVSKDLTKNPLTGVVSNNGVIEIISTFPNGSPCDPTTTDFEVVPTTRAWATHIQNKIGSAYPITETDFSNITITEAFEFTIEECAFAHRLGSGQGVCTCGTGD